MSKEYQRWVNVCNEQGWNEESQIIHLEGFLKEKGLFQEFVEYAEAAADEENAATADLEWVWQDYVQKK